MAKQGGAILNFIAWLTGVLVSLAVGFAMTDGLLVVKWIPMIVTQVAGWIVVVTTIISVVMALMKA